MHTTNTLPVIPATDKRRSRFVRYSVPRPPRSKSEGAVTIQKDFTPRNATFPTIVPPQPQSRTQDVGFNRLNASLFSTLQTATANSLDDSEVHFPQRVQVTDWIDSFNRERDAFKSTTVCAEIIFNRVIKATADLQQPNLLRVATCCMLLDRISAVFGRFQPLLDSLKAELFGAIFIDSLEPMVRVSSDKETTGDTTNNFNLSVSQGEQGGNPPDDVQSTASSPRHTEGYAPEVDDILAAKYMKRTYFEEYQQLQKVFKTYEYQARNAERQMAKQVKVLGRAISHWQKVFLEKVFRAWNGHCLKQRILRVKHARFFLLWKNSNVIRQAFDSWKAVVKEVKSTKLKGKYEETEAGLAQMRSKTSIMTNEVSKLQEDLAKEKNKNGKLEQQVARLGEQVTELTQTVQEQEQTIESLTDFYSHVNDTLKGYSTEYDTKHNPTTTAFLDAQSSLGVQTLPQWTSWVIQQHTEGKGKVIRNIPEDLMDFHAMLVVMHVLAPAIVDKEELYRNLRTQDFTKRADRVLILMRQIGIEHKVTTQQLIQGLTWAHTFLLAQLFIRWCDTFAAAAVSKPAFVTDDSAQVPLTAPHPKVQQLQQRVDTAKYGVRKWCSYATQMRESLNTFLTSQMQTEKEDELASRVHRERELYTVLPRPKIHDILPQQLLEASTVHDQIEQILNNHFLSLRRIYKFYSTVDGSVQDNTVDAVMSVNEFWRFCSDCKIPDKKKVPRAVVQNIFNQANKVVPDTPSIIPGGYNPDAELVPQEFVECLVRIAHAKYEDERNNIAAKLNKLVTMQILPRAKESEVDSFKSELRKEHIQDVLRMNRSGLLKVFQYYASKGNSFDTPNGNNEMSIQEFTAMIKDCKLIDNTFTYPCLKDIFIRIQSDDDPDLRMIYVEFTDALVAVAAYKNPSPFEPLYMRLQQFLMGTFFEVMERKLGIMLYKRQTKAVLKPRKTTE